ncbi:hypothetical protein HOM13_04375 [Candidatus Woesearchaeota archaeon]|jgi:uncharacterized protein|nr:hypothetical protein [Candidatus Woesearchaeota archaeon]MBT5215943.1 hypothetical protein [Candidatus Woesearchaeota archaeon]MBT6402344.1 hypothetical protein [Candidatus Woesearchaeota archaeon]
MKNIIMDTCFILTCLEFKIDIDQELNNILEEQYSLFYIDKTIEELKKKPLEKLAISILNKIGAKPIKTTEDTNVDSLLIAHAEANPKDIFATQDKKLKEKLKKRNVRLITIRQKRYLKIVN